MSEDIVNKARTTLYESQWNQETNEQYPEVYKYLKEMCLVRSLVLYRRRTGETKYMYLNDFKHYQSKEKQTDIFPKLTKTEKILTKTLVRFEVKESGVAKYLFCYLQILF